jgi:transposase
MHKETDQMDFSAYLGLDVHKDTIAVAIADAGRASEAHFFGEIGNTPDAVSAMLKKLGSRYGRLHCVYEAGPCGYGLYRQINDAGHVCKVVSPAHTPRRPGDRVKTDRRDALLLARLSRADELTLVWVPDRAHEAMCDLIRSREIASKDVRQARQRIQGFLLRHGRRYVGAVWKKRHRVWLGNQTFEHPAQQIAFQTYLNAMDHAHESKKAVEQEIMGLLPEWSLGPVVEALQALRGIRLVIAAGVVAEVGDMRRFDNPRQLMAYLGLVPSEHSSGETRHLTGITKAGSIVARRLLVEAAWAYRMPAKIGQDMHRRQEELPTQIRDIAWKAQVRLCARYRRMLARRKKAPIVITAVARELVGFIWAIAQVATPRSVS